MPTRDVICNFCLSLKHVPILQMVAVFFDDTLMICWRNHDPGVFSSFPILPWLPISSPSSTNFEPFPIFSRWLWRCWRMAISVSSPVSQFLERLTATCAKHWPRRARRPIPLWWAVPIRVCHWKRSLMPCQETFFVFAMLATPVSWLLLSGFSCDTVWLLTICPKSLRWTRTHQLTSIIINQH